MPGPPLAGAYPVAARNAMRSGTGGVEGAAEAKPARRRNDLQWPLSTRERPSVTIAGACGSGPARTLPAGH
jgi:hypothetical protein